MYNMYIYLNYCNWGVVTQGHKSVIVSMIVVSSIPTRGNDIIYILIRPNPRSEEVGFEIYMQCFKNAAESGERKCLN